jgi:hypothetical protein
LRNSKLQMRVWTRNSFLPNRLRIRQYRIFEPPVLLFRRKLPQVVTDQSLLLVITSEKFLIGKQAVWLPSVIQLFNRTMILLFVVTLPSCLLRLSNLLPNQIRNVNVRLLVQRCQIRHLPRKRFVSQAQNRFLLPLLLYVGVCVFRKKLGPTNSLHLPLKTWSNFLLFGIRIAMTLRRMGAPSTIRGSEFLAPGPLGARI